MLSQVHVFDGESFDVLDILGTGTFATVYSIGVRPCEMDKFQPTFVDEISSCDESKLDSSSQAIEVECRFDVSRVYAAKTLCHKKLKTKKKVKAAARDLLNEVRVLAGLPSHPNIIQLYGISTNFWVAPESGFLVLERLTEPLDKVLQRWKRKRDSEDVFPSKHMTRKSQAKRVKIVMLDLASALAFLHENSVIFRDLKPANVGFDEMGKVRLFDFGLAKKVDPNELFGHHMTGRIGTLRYMAPEVVVSKPYSFPADVHSFGMMLWEVCALETPFGDAKTVETLGRMVTQTDFTPPMKHVASSLVRDLLTDCWNYDPTERPPFKLVVDRLRLECFGGKQSNVHCDGSSNCLVLCE